MVTWLAGVLLLALAVWRVIIWLFVAAFVPLGVGMGIFNLFFHLELTKLYPEHVGKAHAWGGFAIGAGAIVHAIVFGTMSEVLDVQRTLLVVCILHFVVMGAAWHFGWSQLSFYAAPGTHMEVRSGKQTGESSQARATVEEEPTPALELLVTWRMTGVLLLFFGFMFCGESSSTSQLHLQHSALLCVVPNRINGYYVLTHQGMCVVSFNMS
jgi:MFS family permease